MSTNCPFCSIVRGELPAALVFETESCTAFLDREPLRPGHTLVVPKNHVSDVWELQDGEYSQLMKLAKSLAGAMKRLYRPPRVGLLVAGWDIAHAHVHVVPMTDYHDLTSKRILEGTREETDLATLQEEAAKLRECSALD